MRKVNIIECFILRSIMAKNSKNTFLTRLYEKLNIPMGIWEISFSLFLFIMGWGFGGDAFFSLYIKHIIGGGIWLTLIGTLLPLIKLFIVMPIGAMNDQGEGKNLLLSGKIFYAFSALCYFLAGIHHSVLFLIGAVILNAVGSSTIHTTYRSLYGKNSKNENRSQIFWLYFSSINAAYVIGALLCAWLVKWIDLPYLYLFIVIFGILSILQDAKIQEFIHHKIHHKRSGFSSKRERKQNPNTRLLKDIKSMHNYLGKGGFLHRFIIEIFSFEPRKRAYTALQSYQWDVKVALASQALINFISYIGYLFIPLIAVERNLSLSEIALLFAVMKVPYLVNVFLGKLGDRYNKKLLISLLICIAALLFVLMGSSDNFWAILTISFGVSLVIAIVQPISSALISSYIKPEDKGIMAWAQELISRLGEMMGSLGFGILSGLLGMQLAFQLVGVILGILWGLGLGKRILKTK